MIEYLSFEYCNKNNESHAFELRFIMTAQKYYLHTEHGTQGFYIHPADHNTCYSISSDKLKSISDVIESMKIYSWNKSYPSDYKPSDRIMGCDTGTWSLYYKECGKRTTRHIFGKGSILETFPKPMLLTMFATFFPDFNFREWILSEK